MNQMNQAKYPRIGNTVNLPKPTKARKCAACASDATHKVTVQVNWFRGDDEVLFACDQHRKGDGKKALLDTVCAIPM